MSFDLSRPHSLPLPQSTDSLCPQCTPWPASIWGQRKMQVFGGKPMLGPRRETVTTYQLMLEMTGAPSIPRPHLTLQGPPAQFPNAKARLCARKLSLATGTRSAHALGR